ncbi:VOC family protein [Kitasatospora sp. GAS204B]|uniref:VOC family protein n=1 Tax=unclassified Kitasatospora TaxID=2633591 RepID=UPI002474AEAE|nr:VOC family protein [Kitasatospora sp. GAS204B]MDH6117523.1 PhnB protein [Kitasatospora sp. GAS204B]
MSTVKPIPDNYPRVSPYLFISGAAAAIDFYTSVLGAEQRGDRMLGPDGRIGHAELSIGDSVIMLADENPEIGVRSPKTVGGSPVLLSVYVADVDAVWAKAIAAGAVELRPLANQFYGDRTGTFEDPFGHRWSVASHVEDVPPAEMAARAKAVMGGN